MKLITYYGLLASKKVYRVVMEAGDVQGHVQEPGDSRWHWSGSVIYEIQDTGALSISHEDARAIITAWGGQLDELDFYKAEELGDLDTSEEFAFDEFEPVDLKTSSSFPVAAMVPPGQDRSVDHFDPDFDLWGIPSKSRPETQIATVAMAPALPAHSPSVSGEIETLYSPEEQEFLAAFEGGMLVINGDVMAAEEPQPQMIPVAAEPVDLPIAMIEEKPAQQENSQLARREAMAALREIVGGLSDLGRTGLSWA